MLQYQQRGSSQDVFHIRNYCRVAYALGDCERALGARHSRQAAGNWEDPGLLGSCVCAGRFVILMTGRQRGVFKRLMPAARGGLGRLRRSASYDSSIADAAAGLRVNFTPCRLCFWMGHVLFGIASGLATNLFLVPPSHWAGPASCPFPFHHLAMQHASMSSACNLYLA